MNPLLKVWVFIILVVGFTVFVFVSIWYLNDSVFCDMKCQAKDKVVATIVLVSITGLFVGTMTSYVVSERYENKKDNFKKSLDSVFRFLEPNEKIIVKFLIKSNGKCLQSDISKSLGISRVLVSRTIKDLELKDIVVKKKKGMSNVIELKDDLKKVFIDLISD